MTSRVWLAIITSGVVAAASVAVVLVATRDTRPPAERSAREACDHVDAFTRIVERNGSASSATAELARADRSARAASSLDVRWVPLASGVQALRLAFDEDDARAASSGLAVVNAQCRTVR